jgi:hypothetical protein
MLADMDNLKAHGFNLIKIQTHWAIDEPVEGDMNLHIMILFTTCKGSGYVCYMGFTLEQLLHGYI